MRYVRALLLVELGAEPAPALSALRNLSGELERVVLVFTGGDERSVAAWRDAASAVAPRVDIQQPRELTRDGLLDLARACAVDLLVAGATSLESARLLVLTGRRLGVAVLWPCEQARDGAVEHAFCLAIGERSRAAVLSFLRDHGDPSLSVSVVGPPALSSADLSTAMRVSGVRARVELIPRRLSVRAALEAARGDARVDLIVLARLPAVLLVSYTWSAPVLLVPTADWALPWRRGLDVPDVVELNGASLVRVEEVVIGDVVTTASDRRLAFASETGCVARGTTSIDGEIWLPKGLGLTTSVVAWMVEEEEGPDVSATAGHRFRVVQPGGMRWTLFDAGVDPSRLTEVPTPGARPLAVRLRPNERVATIRRRLGEAGLDAPVIDARAVLDEGPAYDVAEANDEVRLRRVAARMILSGYRASVFDTSGTNLREPPSAKLCAGNRVELEFDNALARRWVLDGIAAAERSVSFQVYMAEDDDAGQAVEAALVAAARRGVAVRVLVDSMHALHGSYGAENPLLSRMAGHAGVELLASRPLDSVPSVVELKQRDHRKLVVIDGQVALLGGRNLSQEYYTGFDEVDLHPRSPWRSVPWLDAGARVEGPAVGEIEESFVSAWVNAGGSGFETGSPQAAGPVALRVVVHRGLRDAHTLVSYLGLIAGAASHIYLVNGFPLALEVQHALLKALARGVRVRVLGGHAMPMFDGEPFPGPWAAARATATEVAHSRLDPIAEAGGEVYFYAKRGVQGWDPALGVVLPHVHAKVLSVDGQRCCVGSANFDITSAYWESELNIAIEHASTAQTLEQRIEELLAESVRLDAADPEWGERAKSRRWMRRWPPMLSP